MVYETLSAEETYEIGKEIGRNALPGSVYALIGDLGVGKTVFTQGVAAGLGITEEMEEIGYEDYFYGEGVCFVEWANLIEELMPENTVTITVEKNPDKGFDYRKITIE